MDSEAEMTQKQMARTEVALDEATRDWEAYTYAQKAEFIASMEKELASIKGNIDELSSRVENLKGESKDDATDRLKALRIQADLLAANIGELKNATASTWDKVKATTGETYDNLKRNFKDARQWMSEAIAP